MHSEMEWKKYLNNKIGMESISEHWMITELVEKVYLFLDWFKEFRQFGSRLL